MSFAISSQALHRRFGKRDAVFELNLAVPAGQITAFLGPNGAGKTTTIRLLLGLLKPTSGTCDVLGFPPGHPEALAQLGAMVESPSLYDHLTGLENLEITRLLRNVSKSEVERVLSLVALTQDARRPVREYSLGMKQRLGVALALMGEPKLLILDEPTNGLDPEGIREMRELIRRLPQETGSTVFISSHILAEMEQVASNVVVIHKGRLCYQGPMDEMGLKDMRLALKVTETDLGKQYLESMGFELEIHQDRIWVKAAPHDAPRLAQGLVQAGIGILEMTPCHNNLEARFLALLEEA